MRLIIEIEGVSFKDIESEGEKKFELETNCFHSFNEVVKCILQSGYMIKAYKMFDGTD